jgi:hypothetical protein
VACDIVAALGDIEPQRRIGVFRTEFFARLKTDVRRSEQLVQNSFKHWIVARQRAVLASAAN